MTSHEHPEGPLVGRHVRLLPVPLAGIDRLYEIALASGAGTTWRTRGLLVGPERFADLVAGELSFAIVALRSGATVGHVGLHGFDPLSGTGDLTAFVDPRLPASSVAAGEGVDLFLRYAFAHAGLRKISIEVPEGRSDQLGRALARRGGITREGTRRAHVRLGDQIVDLALYAVWADGYGTPETSAAPGRGAGGSVTFEEVRALLAVVTDRGRGFDDLTGGHRLVEDLGLDSLALIELVDALDARVAPAIPLDLDAFPDALTVQDLLLACEVARAGAGAAGTPG